MERVEDSGRCGSLLFFSESRKLTCLAFFPFNAAVISELSLRAAAGFLRLVLVVLVLPLVQILVAQMELVQHSVRDGRDKQPISERKTTPLNSA